LDTQTGGVGGMVTGYEQIVKNNGQRIGAVRANHRGFYFYTGETPIEYKRFSSEVFDEIIDRVPLAIFSPWQKTERKK